MGKHTECEDAREKESCVLVSLDFGYCIKSYLPIMRRVEPARNWELFPTNGWYGLALAASQTCSRSAEDMERM
jgi:hypothetical protein